MTNMRKILFSGLISLNFAAIAFQEKNTITEIQASKYIGHLVDNFFMTSNHSGSYLDDLKFFTSFVTNKLLHKMGRYPSFFAFWKVYTNDELYAGFMQESVDFIENRSRQYANSEFKKFYVIYSVDTQQIINKTVEKVRQEVSAIINKSGTLDTGVFTNYFGVPLINKINEIIKKELKNSSNQVQAPKPTLYSTQECPVCFDNFDNKTVKRLFLHCGHNLCTSCLIKWHNAKNSKLTCPLCRAPININDYSSELWPPSAPDAD